MWRTPRHFSFLAVHDSIRKKDCAIPLEKQAATWLVPQEAALTWLVERQAWHQDRMKMPPLCDL